MSATYKLPLIFEEQPEGGYTVTCPLLPELITEGDTVQEAIVNAGDALTAVIELYEDMGRPLPAFLRPLLAHESAQSLNRSWCRDSRLGTEGLAAGHVA
jgi:antitoxin HicB